MFTIPNILTSSNLFFGCSALVSLQKGDWPWCIAFIVLAGIADFLDGFVAKRMKLSSDLGVQLDSLSDVVSFGVVPSMICFQIMSRELPQSTLLPYLSFVLALMAAFRLARYNISSSASSYYFSGLPVPSNGFFFAGLLALYHDPLDPFDVLFQPFIFVLIILIFATLMISTLKIVKIQMKKEWWKSFGMIPIVDLLSLLSYFWIGTAALSVAVLVHILMSLIIPNHKLEIQNS